MAKRKRETGDVITDETAAATRNKRDIAELNTREGVLFESTVIYEE